MNSHVTTQCREDRTRFLEVEDELVIQELRLKMKKKLSAEAHGTRTPVAMSCSRAHLRQRLSVELRPSELAV